MQGLVGNLSDLTVASSQYDILLCSEILISDTRHVSELLVPGFGHPVLMYRGKMPRARGKVAYVRDITEHFANPNLIVVVRNAGFEGLWYETEPLYVQSLSQP